MPTWCYYLPKFAENKSDSQLHSSPSALKHSSVDVETCSGSNESFSGSNESVVVVGSLYLRSLYMMSLVGRCKQVLLFTYLY